MTQSAVKSSMNSSSISCWIYQFFFLSVIPALGIHDTSKKLPIHGDDDEITLSLNFPADNLGIGLFRLNGKYLQLVHPLDRDKDNLSHILFTVSVLIRSMISIIYVSQSRQQTTQKKTSDKDFVILNL